MLKVLALDLEGTLISNAVSRIARPGLFNFLVRCNELAHRVVIYTAVAEPRFREIAAQLVEAQEAPAWFAGIEYVKWDGDTKDLARIPGAKPEEAILVDDLAAYVHPGQSGQWVEAAQFTAPYPADDSGLRAVLLTLETRARTS